MTEAGCGLHAASEAEASPAARSPRLPRRAGADRWLASLVVRGSRAQMRPARLIDDATGRLLHLRFAGSENTFDYFHATKAYLQEWGKPMAFYSDKHGVFRTTHGSEMDRASGLTQFGRALYELNIDIICANYPAGQGPGRARQPDAAGPACEGDCACAASTRSRRPMPIAAEFMANSTRASPRSPQSEGHASSPRRSRESGRRHVPQGGPHAVPGADPALRQGAVHSRADRDGEDAWPARR